MPPSPSCNPGHSRLSQLTAVSQPHQPVLPSLWGHSAGMCDRADKGGGQHPCRLSQKPRGGLWGFPSVESPCPGSAGSGLSCGRGQGLPGPVGAWFGSGGAACDAAALTSILCSAQGIKGQPGLCGEAAQWLLLGQNMKGFYFPCPLWLLASLLAAAWEPWGCRAGCGPGRSVQGPGGL